jgi:hypothetical protein
VACLARLLIQRLLIESLKAKPAIAVDLSAAELAMVAADLAGGVFSDHAGRITEALVSGSLRGGPQGDEPCPAAAVFASSLGKMQFMYLAPLRHLEQHRAAQAILPQLRILLSTHHISDISAPASGGNATAAQQRRRVVGKKPAGNLPSDIRRHVIRVKGKNVACSVCSRKCVVSMRYKLENHRFPSSASWMV